RAAVFAPKSDGVMVADDAGRLLQWHVDNPHPEVTLGTLFGKVWYEGYAEPAYVWQSTGGTDDFEAKLSLTPLIYGTLKGTCYALLFAVPMALLAALYVSEFMHPSLKAYVIPIIFTIAEDSLANVPQHLRAGSLALGATRWQTAVRIVLPTASAGIFSAVMIGFGRAVGETMIVLMATGNTPVMDWSIFNGFRALSANIAVELPEAPEGGTLFRVLFLAAFLLFCLTFAVNTVAELVRLRLRKKFRYLAAARRASSGAAGR